MKEKGIMRTNIEIDDALINQALIISGEKTKKAAVQIALEEYVKSNNRKKILKYRGKMIWEGNLDEMRRSR